MQLAGIRHRPESEDTAVLAAHQLQVRLQTARDDVAQVEILFADSYLWQEGTTALERRIMQPGLATQGNQYWQTTLTVPTNRVVYAFLITDTTGATVGYGEGGFFDDVATNWQTVGNYFHMPYMHVSDAELPPAWVKETVWYQIFPERFANGVRQNDPANVQPWGAGRVHRDSFYGGDLPGITAHLDDLAALGVNGLYLCPIFTSPSNHKYDTIDHFEIDPHFGTKADFQALVDGAHARGMRVMLDAVFNHFGEQSPQWQDVIKNGEQSRFVDWFHIHGWPVGRDPKTRRLNYETFATGAAMPKVNTQNPAVQAYLIDVTKYWIEQFGIDAWRFDVADEVDHGFWRALCGALRAIKPDVYLLGESWHSSQSLVGNGQFNAVMNYPLTQPILALFNSQLNLEDYVGKTNLELMMYRQPNQQAMFNALDTHDTPRLLTTLHGQLTKFKSALTLLMLLPGSPCIYYGTEVAIAGGADPDNRRCMNWQPDEQEQQVRQFVTRLIKFRRQQADFLATSQLTWTIDGHCLILTRTDVEQTIQGRFNLGAQAVSTVSGVSPILTAGITANEMAPGGFELTVA
ncbi:glycoside hydrolase family 13 protein [Lactiplantibacillus plantarum]|uniref:glycoside hydrolase family 13 protein n=1 Tax=Lactiplantibacillus plantarum TaxID=1590 RepID=UPI0012FBA0BF|nr:glycoside hydrolase family 13 protein [Lactiplantibacillus plantarum]KAE9508471.1 Intracellular maltogenic amylase [Lactiplantibacillus plantarum]